MLKRKRSERAASGSPRRPSPESNNRQQPGPLNSPGQGPINSVEDCLAFLREVEEHFNDVCCPGKYKAFSDLMLAQKHGRVSTPCMISQVKELFGGHTEMLKHFNEILQPEHKILVKEDVPEIQDLANLYIAKVKARSSPIVYTTFMHLLYLYNERALTSDEFDREVEVLFAKSCDLLEEYDCFRPDRPAPAVQSPVHPQHSALEVSELQREQQSERLRRMCEKVAKRKRKEKGKGVVTEREEQPSPPLVLKRVSARLARTANALGNRRSSRPGVQAHPRRPARNAGATPATETQNRSRSRRRSLKNAEYKGRAMCTPSYLMLEPPKNGDGDGDGEDEVSVYRRELAKSVLNEECELVPERDSKGRITNPHEEVLFECETSQYECDIIIKKLEVTAESFMNYLFKLQERNCGELPPVKEFLLLVHKRCIQHLYGRHAKAFTRVLEETPARALPVLINRLVLKLEELRSYKIKAIPTWSQVYKNNLHLSLDYSSIDS